MPVIKLYKIVSQGTQIMKVYYWRNKGKGKGHPRTVHEDPEGE
jgi:hypothetical protein